MSKKLKFIVGIVIFFVFVTLASNLAIEGAKQGGSSMEPTITQNSSFLYLTVNIIKYRSGDLVVFEVDDSLFTKRVIAIPNDTIYIADGNYYVNDNILDFPGKNRVVAHQFLQEDEKLTIPDGSYFLVGDNPEFSLDSRVIGLIKGDQIKGKIFFKK